jgi:hypothetical protein
VTTGSHNIHIGNAGNAADTALIRIGTGGTHTSTFIAGIFGQEVGDGGLTVMVKSTGKLGTSEPPASSRRVKVGISWMSGARGDGVDMRSSGVNGRRG